MSKVGLKDENGKIYFGWYVVIMGFILMLFGYDCIVSIAGVFVLPVTEELGFSIGDFVVWMTVQSVASIVFLLIIQKQITEKKLKPIMIISAVCGALGFVGFSQSTELWQFYAFAILLGICFSGLTATPCTVLANNWFGSKVKGVALSLIFGGTSIGTMLTLPLLNYISLTFGWRFAYLFIAGGLLIICIPLVLIFAVWSPKNKGITRMGETEEELKVETEEKPGIPFHIGRKKVSTWIMFLSGTLLVIASVNILIHTQTYLVMNGYSPIFSGNVVSGMIGLLMLGSLAIGAICDRGKLQAAAIVTSILFAVAFVSQLFISTAGGFAIAVLVIGYGFGCPAVNVISPLLINHMYGEKDMGTYISWMNMFISFGGAIGAALIGMILNATGGYMVPFLVCAGLLVVCGIIRGAITTKKFKFEIAGGNKVE